MLVYCFGIFYVCLVVGVGLLLWICLVKVGYLFVLFCFVFDLDLFLGCGWLFCSCEFCFVWVDLLLNIGVLICIGRFLLMFGCIVSFWCLIVSLVSGLVLLIL